MRVGPESRRNVVLSVHRNAPKSGHIPGIQTMGNRGAASLQWICTSSPELCVPERWFWKEKDLSTEERATEHSIGLGSDWETENMKSRVKHLQKQGTGKEKANRKTVAGKLDSRLTDLNLETNNQTHRTEGYSDTEKQATETDPRHRHLGRIRRICVSASAWDHSVDIHSSLLHLYQSLVTFNTVHRIRT